MAETAIIAATMGLDAAQSISQGNQQAAVADYNAKVEEAQATAARESADYQAQQYQAKAKALIATQRADAAASGLGLEGSPFDVMDATASQAAYDTLLIKHAGDVEASKDLSQAALDRLQAGSDSAGGWYGAGASLLTGGSKLAQIYAPKPKAGA